MKFLVIFENYEIASEIEETLIKGGHQVNVCFSFQDGIKELQKGLVDIVLASDMAITDEDGNKYSLLINYLKEIRSLGQKVNLLCKKKAPLNFINACKELNVNVEIANAKETEIQLTLDEVPMVQEDMIKINSDSQDLQIEKSSNGGAATNMDPEGKDSLSAIVAVDNSNANLERQIKGLSGINIIETASSRKELRERVGKLNPDIVIATVDLPYKEEGNWIDICNEINLDTEIYLVKSDNPLNEFIERKLLEKGVVFIEANPSVSKLKEALFPKEDKEASVPVAAAPVTPTTSTKNMERGKRLKQINEIVGSVSNATHSAISVVTEATKAVRSINLSFKINQSSSSGGKRIENLIAVCSPAATGRSFVAQNTAVTLSRYFENIALIDIDRQSQYLSFKMSMMDWEEEYKAALEKTGSFEKFGYETNLSGRVKGNIRIFACDPLLDPKFNSSGVTRLIKYASSTSNYVVVDMPKNMDLGYADAVLSTAGIVIIVADIDMTHISSIASKKDDFDNLDCNKVMVLNKFIKIGDEPDKDVLATVLSQRKRELPVTDGIITIPNKTEIVAISRCIGKPAVILNTEISTSFNQIYQYIKKVGG